MNIKRMQDELKEKVVPSLVTINKYSKIRGVDAKTVKGAITSGRLRLAVSYSTSGTPLIDPVKAHEEWPLDAARFVPKPGDKRLTSEYSEVPALMESKAKQAAADAELAELKLAQAQGKLIDAEEVKTTAFKLARTVRDSMMNIPDRVSTEFAAEVDAFKIHTRLTEEIRKALESLAGVE